jgi:antitoxin component of MazEF toxin-antitoxin module
MVTTTLKKLGGSLTAVIPAAARDSLQLAAETVMEVTVEGNRLILEPVQKPARPKYKLSQLLAEEKQAGINPLAEISETWTDASPVGREIW